MRRKIKRCTLIKTSVFSEESTVDDLLLISLRVRVVKFLGEIKIKTGFNPFRQSKQNKTINYHTFTKS